MDLKYKITQIQPAANCSNCISDLIGIILDCLSFTRIFPSHDQQSVICFCLFRVLACQSSFDLVWVRSSFTNTCCLSSLSKFWLSQSITLKNKYNNTNTNFNKIHESYNNYKTTAKPTGISRQGCSIYIYIILSSPDD